MKQTMHFLLGSEKWAKLTGRVLLVAVAFFFMGLSNASAQYVGSNDALQLLKQEIADLTLEAGQTNDGEVLAELQFKVGYLSSVRADIQDGKPVANAIEDNIPASKPSVDNSGWATQASAATNDETEKEEIVALITFTENLLSE